MLRRLAAQRDFRTVHTKHARVAAERSGMRWRNAVSGQKTKLHQTPCVGLRKLDSIQNAALAALQMCQVLIDTGLHLSPSILLLLSKVKQSVTNSLHLEYSANRTGLVRVA